MRLVLAWLLTASPLMAAAPKASVSGQGGGSFAAGSARAGSGLTVSPVSLTAGLAPFLAAPGLTPPLSQAGLNAAPALAPLAAPAPAAADAPRPVATPASALGTAPAGPAAPAAGPAALGSLSRLAPALEAAAPAEGPGGAKAASALDGLYAGRDARADAEGVAGRAESAAARAPGLPERVARWLGPVPAGSADNAQVRRRVAELKHVLGDAGLREQTAAWTVTFGKGAGLVKARGAGLEGFLYSKLEYEKEHPDATPLIGDYFRHAHVLLSAAPWTRGLSEQLDALGRSHRSIAEKNERLNGLLIASVGVLQKQLRELDPSLAGRRSAAYMVLARAYGREKPGKDFFASFDDAEFARIKKTGANEVWLMDIFLVGEVNRWGTGGGSAFSLKSYKVKPELGGDEGFKAFVRAAHRNGLRVKLDFVPNHTALDSDRLLEHPEDFLHVVPPQHLSDEQIMSQVPREDNEHKAPLYRLVRVRDGRRILVHHPRAEGDVTWVDMAQVDFSRPQARARLAADLARLFREFGVDSVRRDMAYELLSSRFHDRWVRILRKEIASTPEGWMRKRSETMLAGFSRRWKALGHAEVLAELSAAAKAADPKAVLIDEAYASGSELSRAGSDGVYNASDHDAKMGQFGLYRALRSGDAAKVRAALRHAAFRRWQVGGAAAVNYIGTHEEFEGNPVDAFGANYRPAALAALLLRPVLMFNGFEQGVGQARNVKGDLSKSQDKGKALPFDVPVTLDWKQADAGNQKYLRTLLGIGDKHQHLLDRGVLDVLEPEGESTAAAWTAGDEEGAKLLMAADFGDKGSRAVFRFDSALGPLGAFRPEPGRRYVFKDAFTGRTFERDGSELMRDGLALSLPPHGTALYEVEELGGALAAAEPDAARAAHEDAAGRPLNVFIAAGESVPFIKTGGLADVIDALGRGLAAEGHHATVVLPLYAELKLPPGVELRPVPGAFAVRVNGRVETARLRAALYEGVRFLFVEHDYYFARDGAYYGKNVDYTDNDERFVFFSAAVLEAARFMDSRPDIIHAHDWQAALTAPMLEALKSADPFFAKTRSVLTIHNMAYQGRFSRETLRKAGLDGRRYAAKRGRWGFNIMDAGLRAADAVTTVSNTYKEEIQTPKFGEELDGLLRERAATGSLHGIVNGLDTFLYDPGSDPSISAHYGLADAAEGKAANKLALQRALGLPEDASIPVFAVGSRFVRQKGLDLIGSVVPLLAQRGAQLVIVGAGNGEESIERELAELARQHPDTLKLHGFSETFVRLAYAASDFLLMPSRFEPCGLSQLIAQRYGSLPLVTRTGGLADTVTDIREDAARGDGLFIHEFSAGALEEAVLAALALHSDAAALARHRHTAMSKDSSWGPAIERYIRLYRSPP